MMNGSWGWWGPGVFFMVLCMVAMAWMMMGHGHEARGSRSGASHGQRPGGAKGILAERLARGEIDIDEYERRMAALQATGVLDGAEEVRHDH